MTHVAFMRHGPTAWNGARRLQGRADIGLTPRTREFLKARRIPHEFDGWRVLSSPLLRCRETAELLGLQAEIEPRLIEMHWGDFEGRVMDDLRAELGPALAENEARGLDFQPPNGESPRMVFDRLRPLLSELAEDGRDTLCVTHRGVFRTVYAHARAWDMKSDPPDKLDLYAMHVFRLAPDGTPALVDLNLALKRRWRKS
ncbi:MAG: histidine phosphatase family protein [Tagaea sp.]|nr:histidine phosphatase family protein [Tagaea sp.]